MEKLFVNYSKSKQEFINSGLQEIYANKIVFIGNGECIFTKGKFFANEQELIALISNLIEQERQARTEVVNTKVDKVEGKLLSLEDFTTFFKNKLDGLNNYDDTELSNKINTLRNDLDTLVKGDTSEAIETFNEIIAFLEEIEDKENLLSLLVTIESKIPTLLSLLQEDTEHRLVTDAEKAILGQLLFANHSWQSSLDGNERLFGAYLIGGAKTFNLPSTSGLLIAFNGTDGEYKGGQLFFHPNGNVDKRTHWDGKWSPWKTIAFTDSDIMGNATTATQLKINEFKLNDDLNDFINDGVYASTRTDVVGSLLNVPNTVVKGETRLDVKTFGSSRHLKQTLNLKTQYHQEIFYRFKFADTWSEWKQIATTDSNVASATKLSTPVKLWGNDFDGSSDINGLLKLLNNTAISWNNSSVEQVDCLKLNDYNNLVIGEGVADSKKLTIIDGYNIFMRYSANHLNGFLLNESGNVGIGTIDPSSKLDVKSDLDTVAKFVSTSDTNKALTRYVGLDNKYWTIGKGAGSSASVFGFYSSSYEDNVLTLKDNGNVGIGINTPEYKLEVKGATRIENLVFNNNNEINGYALDTQSFTGNVHINYSSAGNVTLAAGGGNVGIGINYSPLYKLEVNGSAAIKGYTIFKDSVSIWNSLAVSNKIASGELVDWYGVSWSEDSSDPTCTRIGNMALHRSLPILSAMQGYLILRPIDFILPLTSNWEKSKYDGAHNNGANISSYNNSNVMVKIPEFWYTDDYEPSTKTHNLKISQTAKAGWCHHKEAYVGAYEGYHDGTYYRSTKNVVPTVSVTREQLRTAARTNGFEDEYKWNIYTYEEHRAICHLFLVEYATRNSQAPVNTALTADGFKQGGLGSGCTTDTVKINGVDTYSFIPTGTTDSLGNGSGQVAYTVTQTDADGNEIDTVTRYANRYRGIENPFGHIWKHVDDVVNTYNTETTYKTVYKCDKPEYFATNKNTKYKPLCSFPGGSKMQGWSKEIKATINCDFFKYSVGGSESTYWCDYNYDNDDTSEHCLLIGGTSDNGGAAGLFSFILSSGVGYSNVYIGSRLTYLPWA